MILLLKYKTILEKFKRLEFRVTDKDNNIIYPTEKSEITRINNIINNEEVDNIIFYNDEDKWYEHEKKTIEVDNQLVVIDYLLDITDFKKVEELYQMDCLTSLLNRNTTLKSLDKTIKECIDNNIPFSIAMGDLDYFKYINDKYGHIAGDLVLEKVGHLLASELNEEGFVGRYGGEEFLIVLKNTTKLITSEKIEEIRKHIEDLEIIYKKHNINNISMSFGIFHIENNSNYHFNNISDLRKELINYADLALYQSKKTGRNRTHLFYKDNTIEKVDLDFDSKKE